MPTTHENNDEAWKCVVTADPSSPVRPPSMKRRPMMEEYGRRGKRIAAFELHLVGLHAPLFTSCHRKTRQVYAVKTEEFVCCKVSVTRVFILSGVSGS